MVPDCAAGRRRRVDRAQFGMRSPAGSVAGDARTRHPESTPSPDGAVASIQPNAGRRAVLGRAPAQAARLARRL